MKMIYKVRDIDEDIKTYIFESYYYNQTSIKDLSELTNISINTIIALLNTSYNETVSRDNLPSFEIDTSKVLVIADTHLGSIKDNMNYIYEAYNKAISEGVGACLHLGDLLQAKINQTDAPLDFQVHLFDTAYPDISDFNTYLLLGNHDFKVFEDYPLFKDILENKESINVLGYKRAYFDWCNYLFAMEHKIKYINESMPLCDVALNFTGHGHELRIKSDARIKAPTLSDDIINQKNGAYPAFMISTLGDDNLNIDIYNFKDNKAKIKSKSYFKKNLIDSYKVK